MILPWHFSKAEIIPFSNGVGVEFTKFCYSPAQQYFKNDEDLTSALKQISQLKLEGKIIIPSHKQTDDYGRPHPKTPQWEITQ